MEKLFSPYTTFAFARMEGKKRRENSTRINYAKKKENSPSQVMDEAFFMIKR